MIINSGFIYKQKINITSIKKISETNNLLASPAASLDRIAIYYNEKDLVIISPKDKIDFIDQLIKLNSKIKVVLKQNNR